MHTHPHLRKIALIYRALSNERRLHILELLSNERLSGLNLVKELGIKSPAVSRHLLILARARLIEGERKGKKVLFRVSNGIEVRRILKRYI